MTETAAAVQSIVAEWDGVRARLAHGPEVGRYVCTDVAMPTPHLGRGEVRLVIVGQDPTVQEEAAIQRIGTVLNLDRRGPLLTFVEGYCERLGVSLDNVYATNACKSHFTLRPTEIRDAEGVDVLALPAPYWLPILHRELALFPRATVISLGQPVLSMLVREGFSREVKDNRGYHRRWREGRTNPMRSVLAEESTVERQFFPFVHQPSFHSRRSEFYPARLDDYAAFVRRSNSLGGA